MAGKGRSEGSFSMAIAAFGEVPSRSEAGFFTAAAFLFDIEAS